MSKLIALDTETTGLDPDTEDVFEIATIDLADGNESVWHIEPRQEVVESMHPKAAEVNRYHERIAEPRWGWADPHEALDYVHAALDGAHIIGAVPDFDTRHLTSLYRRFDMTPPRWHYHLIDIEAMAVGWLHGRPDPNGLTAPIDLPWRSDELSRACGVKPPSEEERHTAIGDARWVARWYRSLTR